MIDSAFLVLTCPNLKKIPFAFNDDDYVNNTSSCVGAT